MNVDKCVFNGRNEGKTGKRVQLFVSGKVV